MTTVFSRIIAGEFPGRFVWADSTCVAFLTIEPLAPGHTLVVPREEIDHWIDCPPETAGHLFQVAHTIGKIQMQVFSPARIGVMVQGFEVPHTHIHVWPANSPADFDFARADRSPSAESLDEAAMKIRVALVEHGHGDSVPADISSAKLG